MRTLETGIRTYSYSIWTYVTESIKKRCIYIDQQGLGSTGATHGQKDKNKSSVYGEFKPKRVCEGLKKKGVGAKMTFFFQSCDWNRNGCSACIHSAEQHLMRFEGMVVTHVANCYFYSSLRPKINRELVSGTMDNYSFASSSSMAGQMMDWLRGEEAF